ncbi:hypothetical protein RM96_10040 [Cupriavidus sp. IDO]|nr:hypothetical protein RM96_10040 [Cupriavidus sp. IDO]
MALLAAVFRTAEIKKTDPKVGFFIGTKPITAWRQEPKLQQPEQPGLQQQEPKLQQPEQPGQQQPEPKLQQRGRQQPGLQRPERQLLPSCRKRRGQQRPAAMRSGETSSLFVL